MSIVVDKVSLQWIDEETLQKIHEHIQNRRTHVRLQIDVTDSANSYQRSMGNINRQRSFVASVNMAESNPSQYASLLYDLQKRIFDQNFTYNEVKTVFKLQFFEPTTAAIQDHDLANIGIQ